MYNNEQQEEEKLRYIATLLAKLLWIVISMTLAAALTWYIRRHPAFLQR